jgi:hypothetical protein
MTTLFTQRPATTITLNEAWELSQSPIIKNYFIECASEYQNGEEFVRGPYWAYWFAKKVLFAEWPEAEELISTDPTVLGYYKIHKKFWAIINRKLADNPPQTTDADGRILTYERQYQPSALEARNRAARMNLKELEESADRVAAFMEDWRRRKALEGFDDSNSKTDDGEMDSLPIDEFE